VVLAVVLVVLATGCTPATLPIGARLTADGQVEAHVRSCPETTMRVTLRETDQPEPPPSVPFSTGTTTAIRWEPDDVVWQGTVAGDRTSVLIPVVLRSDRTYEISVHSASASESIGISSDPYLFSLDDLTTDGVTSSAYRGDVPVSPEQFAESTETTCSNNGLGPYRWLLLALGAVCCTILGGLTFAMYQVGRAIGPKKPKPMPPPAWEVPDAAAPPNR
jgi:hypothetical protein